MIKVSVIVSIWNAGKRIHQCMQSLVSQTLQEIEFICVLDCPTDGTDEIVKDYARQDSRFKLVFNEHNLHVAGSRNKGLDVARGEYIGFLDHDDICLPEMFEELYYKAKENHCDVVVSDAVFRANGRETIEQYKDISQDGLVKSLILPQQVKEQYQQLSHCIWHSIYRKEFLSQNNIRFLDRNKYIDEDRLFNLQVFLSTTSVAHISKSFYIWDQYMESTSNSDWSNLVPRMVTRLEYMIDELDKHKMLKHNKSNLHVLVNFDFQLFIYQFYKLAMPLQCRLAIALERVSYNVPSVSFGYHAKFLGRKQMSIFFYRFFLKLLSL